MEKLCNDGKQHEKWNSQVLNIFSRANLNRDKEKIDTNTVMEETLLFFWVKVNNLQQL